LKARLSQTRTFVDSVDRRAVDAAADKDITFPVGPNQRTMNGREYLVHFVLPNLFFHATTAYAILRHCGVEIGKLDFLGDIPWR
jgi:hypothetical protein